MVRSSYEFVIFNDLWVFVVVYILTSALALLFFLYECSLPPSAFIQCNHIHYRQNSSCNSNFLIMVYNAPIACLPSGKMRLAIRTHSV